MRIGILGAARIAPAALIKPARVVPGVEVTAVAARDPARARAFASRCGIPRVHTTYSDLINDPELDAVYNPLPNSLHAEWSIRALRAGKHVLCEKPMASNALEAEQMVRAAEESGRVLMEAFHFRYHPLFRQAQALVRGGEIGKLRSLEAHFYIPLFLRPHDIRFQFALAGGAMMDTGCYCVCLLRALAGSEPRVTRARARLRSPQVDRQMTADLEFANGITARLECSLAAYPPVRIRAIARGDKGELRIRNPFIPHYFNGIELRTADGVRRFTATREPTYNFQLCAFLGAVRGEDVNVTDAREGLANMRVIDAIYRAAGLEPRGQGNR